MTVEIGIAEYVLSTNGNVDIVTTGLNGVTPKAALFVTSDTPNWVTPATFTGSITIGATDGTRQWLAGIVHPDGNTTGTLSYRRNSTTQCVGRLDTSLIFTGVGTFVKWLSTTDTGTDETGVRVNITSATGYTRGYVILFAGDDVSARADNFTAHATVDSTVNVTAPGFRSKLTLLATTNGASSPNGLFAYGFAANDGATITQRSMAVNYQNIAPPTANYGLVSSDSGHLQIFGSSITYRTEIGDNANGFNATSRVGGSGGDVVYYLALDFVGRDVWVGSFDTPTATGEFSETSPGFKPQIVSFITSMMTAEDTVKANNEPGLFGVSAFTETEEHSVSMTVEDNVSTTNSSNVADNTKAVNVDDATQTAAFDAAFTEMLSTGWKINFSTANGTARKWIGFAVQAESASGKHGGIIGL